MAMITQIAYERTTERSLVIPDGIERILGSFNERWANNFIEEISFPASLVSIEHSFMWCNKLKKIVFRGDINPNLKINPQSFNFVYVAQTAEQILDLDAPDVIKCHIFSKHYPTYNPNMKLPVLLAYLDGKPASGKFEEAIMRYAKKEFEDNFKYYFCAKNDGERFKKLLDHLKPDKKTIELLTRSLEIAVDWKAVDVCTVISEYLDQNCGAEKSKKVKDDIKLKDLGLKERSIADWKKLFRLKDMSFGYIITKYLGKEKDVVVPEFIGKKPVIAIAKGAFEDCYLDSIESPVSPYLSDFFGNSQFPQLNVYGHTELQKKVRTKELKEAKVDQFVLFGSYPADCTDGRRQPIVWRVVDINEGIATLISRFRIEILPMHHYREKKTWENCDLRKWLNELFYQFAFNDQEKQMIVKVHNDNPENPEYHTSSGKKTEDYVYLPSVEEIVDYWDLIHRGDWDIPNYRSEDADRDWIRTKGRYSTYFATYVSRMDLYNGLGCDELAGVRPMIQVKLSD